MSQLKFSVRVFREIGDKVMVDCTFENPPPSLSFPMGVAPSERITEFLQQFSVQIQKKAPVLLIGNHLLAYVLLGGQEIYLENEDCVQDALKTHQLMFVSLQENKEEEKKKRVTEKKRERLGRIEGTNEVMGSLESLSPKSRRKDDRRAVPGDDVSLEEIRYSLREYHSQVQALVSIFEELSQGKELDSETSIRIENAKREAASLLELLEEGKKEVKTLGYNQLGDEVEALSKRLSVSLIQVDVDFKSQKKEKQGVKEMKEEPPSSPSSEGDWQKKRAYILKEVLSTEESYVSGLRTLAKSFQLPLLEQSELKRKGNAIPVLSQAQILSMFSNVDALYTIHLELLNSLKEQFKVEPLANAQIGKLFIEFGPKCIPYAQYGQDYDNCIKVVKQMEEGNPEVNRFFQSKVEAKFKKNTAMFLESILITPIQRIPRYGLLLDDLLKKTPETHPDLQSLAAALKVMRKVGNLLNDVCVANSLTVDKSASKCLNVRTNTTELSGIVLKAQVTISKARALAKLGDVYCVGRVGTDSYTTRTVKETCDPDWDEVWEIPAVDPTKEIVFEVCRKTKVFRTFLGQAREKVFPPLDLCIGSPVVGQVISKKKQNLSLRPAPGTSLAVTGSVTISTVISVGKIVEPLSVSSRLLSQVWRKHHDEMGAEVSIPEIKSHRLFLDLFSAFRAPCPSSLSCFFFRLLAVPSIVSSQIKLERKQTVNGEVFFEQGGRAQKGGQCFKYKGERDEEWEVERAPLLLFYLLGHTRRIVLNPRVPRGTLDKDLPNLLVPYHSISNVPPLRSLDITVALVGAPKVGKTSLLHSILTGKPARVKKPPETLKLEEKKARFLYRPPPKLTGTEDWMYDLSFTFLDIGSEFPVDRIHELPSRPDVFIGVFSWAIGENREESEFPSLFYLTEKWQPAVQHFNKSNPLKQPSPFVLCGNKIDKHTHEMIFVNKIKTSTQIVRETVGPFANSQYFETSTLSLVGIQELMGRVVELHLANQYFL